MFPGDYWSKACVNGRVRLQRPCQWLQRNVSGNMRTLLVSKGIAARTLLGAPGLTTRNEKLLGAKGIATRSKELKNSSTKNSSNHWSMSRRTDSIDSIGAFVKAFSQTRPVWDWNSYGSYGLRRYFRYLAMASNLKEGFRPTWEEKLTEWECKLVLPSQPRVNHPN